MTSRIVRYLQCQPTESEGAVTSRRLPISRWASNLNRAMPAALDTTGIILLSSAAMIYHVIAGLAAAGIGCLALNWRFYSGK